MVQIGDWTVPVWIVQFGPVVGWAGTGLVLWWKQRAAVRLEREKGAIQAKLEAHKQDAAAKLEDTKQQATKDLAEQTAGHQTQVEALRDQLHEARDKALFAHRIAAEYEFQTYKDLWKAAVDLHDCAVSMRPALDMLPDDKDAERNRRLGALRGVIKINIPTSYFGTRRACAADRVMIYRCHEAEHVG